MDPDRDVARSLVRLYAQPTADNEIGTWQPETRDAQAEVPALLAALPSALGRIRRLSLSLDGWVGAHPSRIRVDGVVVRLGWFHTLQPDVVTLAGSSPRRSRLRLLAPDRDEVSPL